MSSSISPVNITAAALIIQFSLVLIFTFGAIFIRAEGQHYVFKDPTSGGFWGIILGFALVTIGLLFFSDEFSNVWKPLFGEIYFGGINWSTALLLIFTLDIVWVSVMVGMTGGSTVSAFSPIYFMLPALAIFLRESLSRIIFYLLLVIILFTWNFLFKGRYYDEDRNFPGLAHWIVSIASLVLTTFIGYVTRPR